MHTQVLPIAVAYMTALNNEETVLGEQILTETFDQDQLTDELLDFIEAIGQMLFAFIDSVADNTDFCADCLRTEVLQAFGQDAEEQAR